MRDDIFRSPYATSTKTILSPCTQPLPEAKVLTSKKADGSAAVPSSGLSFSPHPHHSQSYQSGRHLRVPSGGQKQLQNDHHRKGGSLH